MFAVNGHAALTPSLIAHSHYSATLLESQYPNSCPGQVVELTGSANFCRRRRGFSRSAGVFYWGQGFFGDGGDFVVGILAAAIQAVNGS